MTECSCESVCSRWGVSNDGSGGFFCPYNPFDDSTCKQLLYNNMKPTIKYKNTLDHD